MAGKGRLTELLTQNPLDFKKLIEYGRARKLDKDDLLKLAMTYAHMVKDKEVGSQVTPLHVACSTSKPDIVTILVLKDGWSVNSDLKTIESPLRIALDNGNISVARLLIDLGADVKSFNSHGSTPMLSAITMNKREKTCTTAIRLLLDSGVSINASVDRDSLEKPIHIAVINELSIVVSFLLQNGADINVQDVHGSTPLHIAAYNNKLEIVKLLMLHSVDVYKENKSGDTPLNIAVKRGFVSVIEELVRGGYDLNRLCSHGTVTSLHTAVYYQNFDIVKLLVNLGSNTNKSLVNGATPLHVVPFRTPAKRFLEVKENSQVRKDIAEFLVEKGGQLNTTDSHMNTPLKVALQSGFLGLAKHLIRLGANIDIRADDGDTIFHQVVPLNRDIINLVLEFGGDYNAYNEQRITPYHLAISLKVDLKYIKSFVKHGCPYNLNMSIWTKVVKKCNWGTEQFFIAESKFFKGIKENNLELVKSAVKEGAVPSGNSEDLKYPLHFVAFHGFNELMTFLLEENVQPNIINEKGETALYLAALKGHYTTCSILLRYGACYNYCNNKCPKTPKMIANDFKQDAIIELMDSIDNMFHKARSKKKEVITDLENILLEKRSDFLMYVNAINNRGYTLLTSALHYKRNSNAEEILKLRLKFNL